MGRKKWLTELPLEQMQEETEYEEDGFVSVDEKLQFRQMIGGLSAPLQEIVLLRYLQELSLREIAQIVNLPLRTVQSRMRSALKSLRKELENGGKEWRG